MNQGKERGIWHELMSREIRTRCLWDIRRMRVLEVDDRIKLKLILNITERRTKFIWLGIWRSGVILRT